MIWETSYIVFSNDNDIPYDWLHWETHAKYGSMLLQHSNVVKSPAPATLNIVQTFQVFDAIV